MFIMEHYNNLFDSIDEMNGVLQYTNEELDRYFDFDHLNSNIIETHIMEDDSANSLTENIQVLLFHLQSTLNKFSYHF